MRARVIQSHVARNGQRLVTMSKAMEPWCSHIVGRRRLVLCSPNAGLGLMGEGAAGRSYWPTATGAAARFVSHRCRPFHQPALASDYF